MNLLTVETVVAAFAGGIFGAALGPLPAFTFTGVFVNAGVEAVPVTHHITLPASTAVLALAGTPLSAASPTAVTSAIPMWQALVVGAGFGLLGAVAGEFLQRVFYAHADTHFDPPAASIVVTSFCIALLAMLGVFETGVWIPHP